MKPRIRKYLPQEAARVEHLFHGWEETMIYACLQGVMGSLYAPDVEQPLSAAAQINDFCFLAGQPIGELVEYNYGRDLILTPQNAQWEKMIESVLGDRAVRQIRYAIKKEPDCFDTAKLKALARSLPAQYVLKQIDRELYGQCLAFGWSYDLVSPYPTYEEFERLGLGYVVTENAKVVAGASSYARYRDGIEIQIDTKLAYRRRGLATAAGAALILECLRRGWYPSWDAQNKASVALAKKLGYSFSHEYPVYKCGSALSRGVPMGSPPSA